MTALLVILWIGLSVIVGYASRSRGRSFWAWVAIAVVLSPALAALILIAFPPTHASSVAPPPINQMRGRAIGGVLLVGLIALAIIAAHLA